jgi:hypothetical protein
MEPDDDTDPPLKGMAGDSVSGRVQPRQQHAVCRAAN